MLRLQKMPLENPFEGLPLIHDRYVLYEQQNVPLRDGHFVIHETGNVQFVAKQLQYKIQKKFLLKDFQFGLSAIFSPNENDKSTVEAARKLDTIAEQKEREAQEKEVAKRQERSHQADHFDEAEFRKRRKGGKIRLDPDADPDPEDDNVYENPLMEDCLLGIEQSIYNILVRLRDVFDKTNANAVERERCYITLCHSKLDTGIKVGNFNLHVEDAARIADFITTRLSTFINSGSYLHLDLPLDDSFQVRFQVIPL